MVAQVPLLGTADHHCLCETRRKTVRPWATGRSWAFACGYPGAPARLRVRRIRMAAVPASAAPGSSGCSDEAAGACPGSDGRKRTQSQLPQRPRQQQQQQRRASHGPRGSTVGDSRGIGPGSGRHDLSQLLMIRSSHHVSIAFKIVAVVAKSTSAQAVFLHEVGRAAV